VGRCRTSSSVTLPHLCRQLSSTRHFSWAFSLLIPDKVNISCAGNPHTTTVNGPSQGHSSSSVQSMPEEASNRTSHRHSTASATPSSKKRRRALETVNSSEQSVGHVVDAAPSSSSNIKQDLARHHESDGTSPTRKRSRTGDRARLIQSPKLENKMYSFPKSAGHTDASTSVSSTPPSPLARKVQKVAIVGPQVGARRLVVRNIRPVKTDTQKYYGIISLKLNSALDSILSQQEQAPLLLEELYQGVKNVCKQGHGADLRTMLTDKMKSHASDTVRPRIKNQIASSSSSSESLRAIVREWSLWKDHWKLIKSIFFYMDPSSAFEDLFICLFLDGVMSDQTVMSTAKEGTVDILMAHRLGVSADPSLCCASVDMFIELGLYTKSLEVLIFEKSQTYFNEWADERVGTESLSSYIHLVNDLFASEMKRCELFKLSSSTRQELEKILEEAMIQKHKNRLVQTTDVMALLSEDKENDLKLLYSLLQRCRQHDLLRSPFETWIKHTGEGIVFDDKQENNMVVRLMTLRKQTDRVYITCFNKNGDFTIGLRKAFEHVMNKTRKSAATHGTDNTKQGEMIAKFVDFLLRGGSKVIPTSLTQKITDTNDDDFENEAGERESVLNEQLDQVLDIFRFLQGKAVFEEFYKKDLAKRLLMGRSASADAELSMLARLKAECGESFTQNLETMFKDVELSREEMAEQKAREEESGGSKYPVDLSVSVLSSSAWPSYPEIKVKLPQQIEISLRKFEENYKSHHKGRTLHWKHSLAHCQLKANFPSGRKELVVSGFQAIVLLLFNEIGPSDQLSYQQLADATNLRTCHRLGS
jgi:cullin 4